MFSTVTLSPCPNQLTDSQDALHFVWRHAQRCESLDQASVYVLLVVSLGSATVARTERTRTTRPCWRLTWCRCASCRRCSSPCSATGPSGCTPNASAACCSSPVRNLSLLLLSVRFTFREGSSPPMATSLADTTLTCWVVNQPFPRQCSPLFAAEYRTALGYKAVRRLTGHALTCSSRIPHILLADTQ